MKNVNEVAVEAPAVNAVVEQAQQKPVEQKSESDLMTRIAQFRSTKKQDAPTTENSDSVFDYKEIENIKDPVAKDIAVKAYKSMQSNYTRKTQELAEQRKITEQKMKEMENWSPERIQRELLNNPQFLQAAKQVAGNVETNPQDSGLTDEQFSALTDREKAELTAIKSQNALLANEINALKQNNYQSIVASHDAQLQTKFPDYNPVEIDATIQELSKMSPLDIRLHVYKSLRHDVNVQEAYELGRQEAQKLNQERVSAFSPYGNITATSDGVPIREKSDTDQSFFMKLASFRLAQSKKR